MRIERILPGMILVFGAVVWISTPLLFAPVPWPDDSAYWITGRDFWATLPPRLIMRSQAAFVPSYAEVSFNTMPLLPILTGLGDLLGVRGTFAVKFWPMMGWMMSGVVLLNWIQNHTRVRLSWVITLAALFAFHPILRWSSNLLRPEPLIGAIGMTLVLCLSQNEWNRRLFSRLRWGDPIAVLLAVAAYLHFNAIHLVPMVFFGLFFSDPKRLLRIAGETLFYLSPWLLWCTFHVEAFQAQMQIQFERLSFVNPWLDNWAGWKQGLFQTMGNPLEYEPILFATSWVIWLGVAAACVVFLYEIGVRGLEKIQKQSFREKASEEIDLLPAAAWVLSALLLWHFKAEVWFTHYLHLSWVAFVALILARLEQSPHSRPRLKQMGVILIGCTVCIFGGVSAALALQLQKQNTWTRSNFEEWVDCVDRGLSTLASKKQKSGSQEAFSVWAPTFPDILVELSIRHPDWELTRTNDFHPAIPRALAFATKTDALVFTEFYAPRSEWREGALQGERDARSVWLNWKGYYYSRLEETPGFKPTRSLCQAGRLQAFILAE